MSFRDIGAITNKVKLQADRERGYTTEDIQPRSDESRAFKLFSEDKSPIQVVIALDLPAHYVQAKYQEYWECKHMYELVQIYEARYDLYSFLKLCKIAKDLGMEENDIRNIFELAKHNQLQYLQWKVQYLKNEIKMLEDQKTKATKHLLVLNRRIDDMYVPWAQQKGQMGYMNKESEWYDNTNNLYPVPYSWYDNTGNLYPTYPKPYINSYSFQLSYSDYWP
jgi:hypothetical protein